LPLEEVVESENAQAKSLAALEEAIFRGYYMVEINSVFEEFFK